MITLNEFIECFEVLLESGLAPPLNMVLGLPQKTATVETRLSSEEKELMEECRPVPQLHPGKKGTKLREKVKQDMKGKTRNEHLYNCEYNLLLLSCCYLTFLRGSDDATLTKKKEELKQQVLYENSKELTFQPTLYTRNRPRSQGIPSRRPLKPT